MIPLTWLAPVAEELRSSVVQIRHGGSGAAGVRWGPEGKFITNAHVVHRGRVTVIRPDGVSVPGEVVRMDQVRDLALVQADLDVPRVRAGDPGILRPGALVFAVGHPMGVTEAVSAGIFQAVGPMPHGFPLSEHGRGLRWVQADIRLAPGNSGGPIADAFGRVVGIVAMIMGGLALAVPANDVQAFLSEALHGAAT